MKNYLMMTVMGALTMLVIFAGIGVAAYYKSAESSSFRSFSVSGEGKVVAIPDVAEFTFGVITEGGKDIAGLQKLNTDKVNKIIDFVKSAGVADKDIKTQNYSLTPRYKNFPCPVSGLMCPPSEIAGYSISQFVQVKVRDFNKIGDLLSGAVENGANTVSQLNFAIDDPTAAKNSARTEAILKARKDAESIALAGGFRLGKLLSVEEENGPVPVPMMYARSAAIANGSSFSPTIEPGSEEVRVGVILRYAID